MKLKFLLAIILILTNSFATASFAMPGDPIEIYRQRKVDATPTSVFNWLKEGNQQFANGRASHGGYPKDARERVRVTAQGQRPLATILSCIDSRTTPELIFDTSVGDLFTARVGANVVNDDILPSTP